MRNEQILTIFNTYFRETQKKFGVEKYVNDSLFLKSS